MKRRAGIVLMLAILVLCFTAICAGLEEGIAIADRPRCGRGQE